jgi:MerR family transcriptional regulator, light-induced transcriptional regulator
MKYLSPKLLADAIGVSESSLKRWADEGRLAVERTAGGHRRIPLGEAVRFLRQSGMRAVRPELLGLPAGSVGKRRDVTGRESATERLIDALLEDRAADARSLIVSLYTEGAPLGWLLDGPIRESLSHVGGLWEHGAAGVFLEHRATETCSRSLAELRSLMPPAAPDAPVAVGGSYAGDVYHIPPAMVALVLAEAGFQERNLGPDVPVDAMLAAIDHYRPRLAWQCFSIPPASEREAAQDLERIVRRLEGGSLVIGGKASHSLPLLPGVGMVPLGSMTELAAFARGVLAGVEVGTAGTLGVGREGWTGT